MANASLTPRDRSLALRAIANPLTKITDQGRIADDLTLGLGREVILKDGATLWLLSFIGRTA
jgi:hypothetical protein